MKRSVWNKMLTAVLAFLMVLQLVPIYASAVDWSSLCGVWVGTYTGTNNGSSVERDIRLDIDYAANGKFEGIATIDNGDNGRYFFDGTISADGEIQFQGSDWIVNPSNFGFGVFSGGYYETENRMDGNVDGASSRVFSLSKVSNAYESLRVDLDEIPREWDGEYDGHHNSIVVRRVYEFHIQSMEQDGTIKGMAIIAPSEKADAAYGANGSYYFKGKIDARYGKISMQGYQWIEYPASYSNFTFVALQGYFDFSSGAKIHGISENGIWEMSAIHYDDINVISGFTLGEDNNHFVHTSSATWDGAGFVGVTDYTIDDAYFQKLTQYSSKGEKNRIKKEMQREWGGSCYGIAMSMGLLYEGYIGVNDLTNAAGANSYYSLNYPYKDRKFLNMINYYQLSQGLENGGKRSAAVSASYNNGIFTGLVNWINGYDSLPVFLKKMVNYCSSDHVELLGFSTKDGGHAVLITGCEFDTESDTYQVQIYDENCISSSSSIGEFGYMTVAKDFSSFSYTDANGDLINNDTYSSIYFLDWSSMGSVIAPTSSDYSDHTKISFPMGQEFKIVNASGQYLAYDGTALEGNIPIYGIDTADYDDGSRFVIETSNTDTLTVSDTGEVIDVEAYGGADYMSVKGTAIDSAVLDMDSGISLSGDDYQFETYISTAQVADGENGLISLSAKAASDVNLTSVGTSVVVTSDEEITNVSTGSYIGADSSTKQYIDTGAMFTIEQDAGIENAVEITGLPFTDVSAGAYYYEAVQWAVEQGVTSGTSATTFSPDATCTRAQVVTFLWRAAGSPKPSSTHHPFTDIQTGAYYYDAVLWAVENGITNGTSVTTFSPNRGCTRGQVVAFIHRFENSPKPENNIAPFGDIEAGDYYYDAVLWAVENGITNGTSSTTFSPDTTCTRAQIVTFLYRDRA